MPETMSERHERMDEAYDEFMSDFRPYLERKITELVRRHNLPADSVMTVTGRGLIELGAVDLIVGLGGKDIAPYRDEALDFSNKILACTTVAAQTTLKKLGVTLK